MHPKILLQWTHKGRPYRLVEGEDFNPAEPEYVIEELNFATRRWTPTDALVLETSAMVYELLKARQEVAA